MMETVDANKSFWNDLTDIHEGSPFYDVPAFLAGKNTLHKIELEELADVRGKSLLHLQCHFGMDTLSWARLGAQATGVDFSDRAVSLARKLNSELGLSARFMESDVYELPKVLDEKFDVVFTSYGVLCWLADLNAWARTIAHFLKPGGTFLLVEEHPLAYILDENCKADDVRIGFRYFDTEMLTLDSPYSYSGDDKRVEHSTHHEWTHTLSEIFSALLSAGLSISSFKEYPYCMYQKFPWLSLGEDDLWYTPAEISIPLLFSLKAAKIDHSR
jgi:ubiquinone/menaquinone biosynthesis C-methylase UbiE